MEWYRSTFIEAEKAILHVFVCPRCQRMDETKTPAKAFK
jgi:hypothetical protein